ncbi:hypothetical protein C8T65DRAFT_588054, partial [Cerioporus squamosus]
PLFLYNKIQHVPGKMCSGLFKGPILAAAYKHIYNRPVAVNEALADANNTQGQPSILEHYKIREVSVEHIIYVRVLLAAMPRWKAQDGAWKGANFVNTLLHIFCRPVNHLWREDLLGWWNKYVPFISCCHD